jgi:hypothetical protein
MKTQALIQMLVTNAEPAPKHVVSKALAWPLLWGLVFSSLASVATIGPLSAQDLLQPTIWVKFVYGVVLASTLVLLLNRLYRPGVCTKKIKLMPWAVLLVMMVIGFAYVMSVPQALRMQMIFGQTWLVCPWFVLGLSIPALMALLVGARRLAPTNLKVTGFTIGLLAGSIGALGYSFACPETSLTFVAIWYTTGILLVGLVGRLLAPSVLRW